MTQFGIIRRIVGAIGAILLVFGGTAAAQDMARDAERTELAAEFATIVESAEMESLFILIIDRTWWALDRRLPPATDAATRAEIRAYVREGLVPIAVEPVPEIMDIMLPQLTEVAARLYTTEELLAWLDFYATEAGQRLLRAQVDGMSVLVRAWSDDTVSPLGAGGEALNAALRKNGLAEVPTPDDVPMALEPEPLIPTEAIVAARGLVALSPEALDELATFFADEFVGSRWLLMAQRLDPPAGLRDSLRAAFMAGVTSYYRQNLASGDTLAAVIAAALTPAELAEAVAFHGMPAARDWQPRYEALRDALEDGFWETPMPTVSIDGPAFERRFAEIGVGVNAILAREGLPPIEF